MHTQEVRGRDDWLLYMHMDENLGMDAESLSACPWNRLQTETMQKLNAFIFLHKLGQRLTETKDYAQKEKKQQQKQITTPTTKETKR